MVQRRVVERVGLEPIGRAALEKEETNHRSQPKPPCRRIRGSTGIAQSAKLHVAGGHFLPAGMLASFMKHVDTGVRLCLHSTNSPTDTVSAFANRASTERLGVRIGGFFALPAMTRP